MRTYTPGQTRCDALAEGHFRLSAEIMERVAPLKPKVAIGGLYATDRRTSRICVFYYKLNYIEEYFSVLFNKTNTKTLQIYPPMQIGILRNRRGRKGHPKQTKSSHLF